jgi:anti-anti-sigma factor
MSRFAAPYGRHVPRPLELEVRRGGPDLVIEASGDLDLTARPALDAVVSMATTEAVEEVLLDLSRVTFCDPAGLRALCEASAASASSCRQVTIRASDEIVRIARLTGPEGDGAEADLPPSSCGP